MQENSCLKPTQISYQLWCLKNEQHLIMDKNFDHQMSLSKGKRTTIYHHILDTNARKQQS